MSEPIQQEHQDLFFELGCEELPPTSLLTLRDSLESNICSGLEKAALTFGETTSYATPRRLAVWVKAVQIKQPDSHVNKRGPAVKAAYDKEGNPSKAATGFARSCGVGFEQLTTLKTDKGEWLAYNSLEKGLDAKVLIADIVQQALSTLPIAKRMRWADHDYSFVRPVHWAILLFGQDVIQADFYGAKTSNITFGHRFHAPQAITINNPAHYASLLKEQGFVIADVEQRKKMVHEQANAAAKAIGSVAHIEADLLDEITALVELPVAVTGSFDAHYLNLPKEVLITTMQGNQKYFPVLAGNGDLMANFITISNIKSSKPSSVIEGNERVIMPRLSDAEFFWQQDIKTPLSERVESLGKVVFQHALGSILDKTHRVDALAQHIAKTLGVDETNVSRAALLSKTDLVTDMVGEFASLQGTMGRYYAAQNGENADVACAIEEQYLPKQAGGNLPASTTGQVLSLADKLDTLVGIFSAGLIPTGDKDPFALRRASLGILRIIIELELNLDLKSLVFRASERFSHEFNRPETQTRVLAFLMERLRGYTLSKGYRAEHFNAVAAVKPTQPLDFMHRLKAVQSFSLLDEAASLGSANKRIKNLLKKAPKDILTTFDASQLKDPAEIVLNSQLEKIEHEVLSLTASHRYIDALKVLSTLKAPVDAFFEDVFIMADDEVLRFTRLSLLKKLQSNFIKIADISNI